FQLATTAVAVADHPPAERYGVEALPPPAPRAGTTILVADDSTLNLGVATSMLERLGYEVEAVSSGREALAALERRAFDAVLMDCWMPDLDGFDATRELRRREPPGRHVPVIALTADVLADARDRCLAAGMDDYLAKPVHLEELTALLQRWVPLASPAAPPRPPDGSALTLDPDGPIDPTALAGLGGAGPSEPGFVQLVVEQARADVPARLAAARAAHGQADAEGLARVAHKLKGEAATVGLREVHALAAQLQEEGERGDL